ENFNISEKFYIDRAILFEALCIQLQSILSAATDYVSNIVADEYLRLLNESRETQNTMGINVVQKDGEALNNEPPRKLLKTRKNTSESGRIFAQPNEPPQEFNDNRTINIRYSMLAKRGTILGKPPPFESNDYLYAVDTVLWNDPYTVRSAQGFGYKLLEWVVMPPGVEVSDNCPVVKNFNDIKRHIGNNDTIHLVARWIVSNYQIVFYMNDGQAMDDGSAARFALKWTNFDDDTPLNETPQLGLRYQIGRILAGYDFSLPSLPNRKFIAWTGPRYRGPTTDPNFEMPQEYILSEYMTFGDLIRHVSFKSKLLKDSQGTAYMWEISVHALWYTPQ
ncbi:MAG: hypothetical protein FWG38_10045, partial [Defluviitaleaceae bacterium]|nr:hypothetical protein [Defluviitaleaceae bacterium]